VIGHLSKGYRQRVGLAQAIVHQPRVLILDEPTVGLDPRQVIEIRQVIRGLAGEQTVVLSTHILPEVQKTCSRVVIINEGMIVAADSIEDLTAGLGRFQTLRLQVARFAATRNDEATWTTDAGGTVRAESVYMLLVALLEAQTVAWSDGKLESASSAALEYATDTGETGRLTFEGESATWDVVPGVVFRLAAPPPPVPPLANPQ